MKKSLFYFIASVSVTTTLMSASCHHINLPDTQLGNWVAAAAINSYPRGNATCFVIGDKAFVGLGNNGTIGGRGVLSDFWTFSLDSGWTQIADFPGPARSNAVGFSCNGSGYVGTGTDGVDMFSDFYQYDTTRHSWIKRASFPGGARYDAVGFGVQGKGYLGTGYSNYWLNDFYQYDPASDSWGKTPGTIGNFTKRRGASAFVYNNQAYIVGGSISGGMARDFWLFDPSQKVVWKQLSNITNTDQGTFDDGYTDIVREYASAFVNGDKAYLTLGRNGGMVTSTWAYDFARGVWSRRTPYPKAGRYGSIAFTIGGKSFVGTGATGNTDTFDDFEMFLPDVAYNANDY